MFDEKRKSSAASDRRVILPINEVARCPACQQESEFYAQKHGCAVFRCDRCGTLFVYPEPEPAETSALYSQEYFCGGGSCGGYVDYDEDKRAMDSVFLSMLRLLQQENSGTGKLLDVGAATGYFVALARKAGWDARGIEISGYAVSAAKKKHLPVEEGTLPSFHSVETFDAITFWDVFEHLTNPAEHLRAVLRLLKPGGRLALITPRADSFWARMTGVRWHLLIPPEHVVCYSAQGITSILEANGFQVTRIESVAKRFTLPYTLHIAKNWLKWKWLVTLENCSPRFLRTVALPLNLHDNMFVVAEKL